MAVHNQKGNKRQAGQESAQDLANQSFDPTFGTFVNQVVGSPDGVNLYKLAVNSSGALPVVNLDGSAIGGAGGTLPLGAATETTLALIKAKTDNLDVLLSTRTKPADAQHVIVDSGVTTGLTDTQLRATPVPVSGTVTTSGITDTQIRATPLPVSGTVNATLGTETTKVIGVTRTADGAGNLLTSTTNALDINIKSGNPTTMPVTGPLTDTQLRATAVPVSLSTAPTTPVTGTFFQATQPVSMATNTPDVTDRAGRLLGTIANTAFTANAGTNLNTSALALETGGNLASVKTNTTPLLPLSVTGNITTNQAVNISSANAQTVSINVSGTWTGTIQPQFSVDGVTYANVGVIPFGTAAASVPSVTANGNYWVVISGTKNFQMLGATVASGTAVVVINTAPQGFGQLAVQSVAANLKAQVTIDQTTPGTTNLVQVGGSLPTGANTIGAVNIAAAQTLGTVTTVGAVTAITNALPIGANVIGKVSIDQTTDGTTNKVSGGTLTKGTQGANGFTVQDLKDSGRVNILWTAEFPAVAVTETLLTLTESRDGAAVSTFTTKVVTTGKRLRITSISMAVESGGSTGTAIQRAILRMRYNTAGAVTTASPLQGVWQAATAAALKATGSVFADFPDGIEFLGDGTKQIGFTLTNPDWVVTTSIPTTRVTIFGYEY